MNPYALRFVMIVILGCMLYTSPAHAQKNSADVVKATAIADKPDGEGKQTVTITLAIDKPWHLYANPVQNKDLANNATLVEVNAGAKLEKVDIVYPVGKLHKEQDGSTDMIYEETATIKAMIVRATGDSSPLSVVIKVNTCNDESCLFPGKVKLDVK